MYHRKAKPVSQYQLVGKLAEVMTDEKKTEEEKSGILTWYRKIKRKPRHHVPYFNAFLQKIIFGNAFSMGKRLVREDFLIWR